MELGQQIKVSSTLCKKSKYSHRPYDLPTLLIFEPMQLTAF